MKKIALLLSSLWALTSIAACVSDAASDPGGPADGSAGDAAPGQDSGTTVDGTTGGDSASCTAPQTTCGTSCVLTTTDGKNCGACGHDCLGGMCADGKCQPKAVFTGTGVDAATSGVGSLVVDPKGIYWVAPGVQVPANPTDQGKIYSCPLSADCTVPRLLFGQGEIDQVLTVAGSPGFIYWSDPADDGVFRIATDGADSGAFPFSACTTGASPCPIQGGMTAAHVIASDGTFLYAATNYRNGPTGPGEVYRGLLDGGTIGSPTDLGPAVSPVGASAIALDPDDAAHAWAYVLDIGGNVKGYYVTHVGTQVPCPIGNAAPASGGGIVVAYQKVFWTNRTGGKVYVAPARPDSSCPTASTTIFATVPGSDAITADAQFVYWSAQGGIFSCPVSGCPAAGPTTLTAQIPSIHAIANDAKAIYWGDEKGSVWRLAK